MTDEERYFVQYISENNEGRVFLPFYSIQKENNPSID